ncbi:TlpA family protein disulfide reductase [bacterium]|nr:TlpA family protein disulfide reductase [bacterium]MCB2179439.1 TlpA family protein disulfide reductase [bacterium]
MDQLSNRQFRLLALGVIAFSLIWTGVSAFLPGGTDTPGIAAPQAGFLAPEFTLTTLDDDTVSLADLRGQAVLVNIWASWCIPCRSEMPAMQRMYEEYSDDGFMILAVNATNQDSRQDAADFVAENGLTFPILLDIDGTVGAQYQVSALPSSFFILPDGTIQEVVIGGPMAEALLRTRIENLLKEVN